MSGLVGNSRRHILSCRGSYCLGSPGGHVLRERAALLSFRLVLLYAVVTRYYRLSDLSKRGNSKIKEVRKFSCLFGGFLKADINFHTMMQLMT